MSEFFVGAEASGFGFDFWVKGSVLYTRLKPRSCFLIDGAFGSADIFWMLPFLLRGFGSFSNPSRQQKCLHLNSVNGVRIH